MWLYKQAGYDISRAIASQRSDLIYLGQDVADLKLDKIKGAEGVELALEFMYNDFDSDGEFVTALRWNVDTPNGDTPPWQSTEYFGVLRLVAAPAAETAEITPAETVSIPVTAPQTGDSNLVFAVIAVILLSAVFVYTKKHSNRAF